MSLMRVKAGLFTLLLLLVSFSSSVPMRRAPSSSSGTPSSPHQDERFNRYADASEPFFHQSQAPSWSDQYLPSPSLYSSTSAFPTFPALPQYDFQQYYQAAHQYPPYHSNQLTHIEQTQNSDNYNHMNSRNQVGLDGMMQSFNSVLHHTNEPHPYLDYRQMQTSGQSQYSYGSATHFDSNIGTHVQSSTSSTRHKQFKDPDPFAMHSCPEEEESLVHSHHIQSEHYPSGQHDCPRDPDPFAQSYDDKNENEEEEEAFVKDHFDGLSHPVGDIHSDSSDMDAFIQSIYDDNDQLTSEPESIFRTHRRDNIAPSRFGYPNESYNTVPAQTSSESEQSDYNRFPFAGSSANDHAPLADHRNSRKETSKYIWLPWKQEIPEDERAAAISALLYQLKVVQRRTISEVSEELCIQALKRNANRQLISQLLRGSANEKSSATELLLKVPGQQEPSKERTNEHIKHMQELRPDYKRHKASDYLRTALIKHHLLEEHLHSANKPIRDYAFQRWWDGRKDVRYAYRHADNSMRGQRDGKTPLSELFGEDDVKKAEVISNLKKVWGASTTWVKLHLSRMLFYFPNITRRLLKDETFLMTAIRLAPSEPKRELKRQYDLADHQVALLQDSE